MKKQPHLIEEGCHWHQIFLLVNVSCFLKSWHLQTSPLSYCELQWDNSSSYFTKQLLVFVGWLIAPKGIDFGFQYPKAASTLYEFF